MRMRYVRNLSTGFRSRSATKGATSKPQPSSSSSNSLCLSELQEDFTLSSLKLKRLSDSDDSASGVFKHISSIFHAGKPVKQPDSEKIDGAKEFERVPNLSWLSSISQNNILLQRKEQSHKKKQKYVFEVTQENRFQKLVEVCGKMLGPEATLELFGKLGRETDVKGYNALVEMCIDKARQTDDEDIPIELENYLLALCESERTEEILKLLEIIDIKNLSSVESVAVVFQALGRLILEPLAEKFLFYFKNSDHEAHNITNFIACYAVSIPNLSVEDVIKKFKDLHQRLEVSPSSSSYQKIILHSCALHKVHVALDIVKEMCEAGLTLSTDVLHSILQICDETSEYNLVHQIFFTICRYNLESNDETFRSMINLFLKMKDVEGAYKMLDDLEELNLKPTTWMYKCFREVLFWLLRMSLFLLLYTFNCLFNEFGMVC
ncbi:hypothetical protein PHAVU_005G091800 [Phaseolus vulgaris]|uniref:Uncharacterized protein n=1 Tax=Phaseolus vulgaris TaxID=3885 RepID=V7BXD0_PHAVU|nr:hypothetical protein PHAVU_005G091800g [Phaseolus vulgaris]ESW21695.1 hypothetical protein PHAVU_005G091800g [Phaseolus vulgaris]